MNQQVVIIDAGNGIFFCFHYYQIYNLCSMGVCKAGVAVEGGPEIIFETVVGREHMPVFHPIITWANKHLNRKVSLLKSIMM